MMKNQTISVGKLKGYRFPKGIINHIVWFYHRFMLSLRDISEIMLKRGIRVSYESIREWGIKFGRQPIFVTCNIIRILLFSI